MDYKVTIETGEYLPDGTPLVRSLLINGRVTTPTGDPVGNAAIRIIEPDINDIGEGRSNPDGTFSIRVGDDTTHQVWVNGVMSQLVKVLTKG
ncbi:carboxypeptidase-like regulatory domain-containing protein [Taibaiella soli]|uniref:Carboxypeptidase regulatory-like domain-containing protein n=1 Tax=Taibaiella soli TaxID=1649169 RepID=A0A2W2AWB0_9BACT|nr:carboxypeptidase-like regulatory domain-containing protein [Taibaiella soli]PZF71978.1 hypothetical protein DN068_15185 [Taibaiella soli]